MESLVRPAGHSCHSTMKDTPTAPDIGVLNTTSQFEEYLQRKFRALLRGVEEHVPFPTHWTLDLLSEVDRIAFILVEAFHNPSKIIYDCMKWLSYDVVRTSWDASRYCDLIGAAMSGLREGVEEQIMERYPPIYSPARHERKPLVVTDLHRNILVWYLPVILTAARQVSSAGVHNHSSS